MDNLIRLKIYFRHAKVDDIKERDSSKGFEDSGSQSNENETPPESATKNDKNGDKITAKLSGKFKDQVNLSWKKIKSKLLKNLCLWAKFLQDGDQNWNFVNWSAYLNIQVGIFGYY